MREERFEGTQQEYSVSAVADIEKIEILNGE
jgi:hypothetical protein